ncbi:putative F-box/kelch-repeat protein [Cardamine amara subsp. amara]|uniref:F-box/kelch-repeat protein n=1 Tax=Cardamine amara subsp. amara TaxID=228776 RepID=A0ABD1BI04_CARAN
MTNIKESSPVYIPYIPDDVLLNCLARVSRLYYPTLSLVSKRFRSLVASLDLYDIRTFLGRTENCLYVCILFGSELIPRWFTLSRRPTRIRKLNSRWFGSCFRPYRVLTNPPTIMKEEKKSSDINLMVSIPPRSLAPPLELTRIAIGSNIYLGCIDNNGAFTSRFFFMDCRSHTLHEVPSTRVARKYIHMKVLDGKVYVVEGSKDPDYSNLIEFFDTKTLIWEHVPSPSVEIGYVSECLVFNRKLYLFGDKIMVYKPTENKWDDVGLEMPLHWVPSYLCCVVDNIIYSYGKNGVLCWYDSQGRSWKLLKGLEKLPKLPEDYTCVRLVEYGEKIAVLWEKKVCGLDNKKIWCAAIALEKGNGQTIYGKIEWCDVVLTVPKSSFIWEFTTVNV